MQKAKKLEEDKVLFKVIEEEEYCIKAEYKTSTNFALIKLNAKPKRKALKDKKEFVKWPKCKKCDYKHLTSQAYKYANKEYDKCHKKEYISCFHDSYTSFN